MNSAKVVGIHGGNCATGHVNAKPMPGPLIKLRDSMKIKVKSLLRKLFESADDSLFEMADKAGSNGDQAMYFDAMRELRMQRKLISTEIFKGLIQSFNELGRYRSEVNKADEQEYLVDDLEELSLIQNDELELKVAVDGMVNRLRNTGGPALSDLHTRIEYLVSPISLSLDQTPASPEILCECFAVGCTALNIEMKAQLVVFKLFEKFVLSEMNKVYSDANQLLMQQGVMPDLKKSRKKQHKAPPPTQANSSIPNSVNQVVDDIPVLQPIDPQAYAGELEALRQLMHPNTQLVTLDAPALPSQEIQYHTQNDLVSALSICQKQHEISPGKQIAYSVIDYRALLNKSFTNGNASTEYSELDSDVINLVSMLFEFILEDRQLQPEMKALIARLQIPMLKVAIMDRTFFSRGGHPARKLLNEIASAAIGWNEKKNGKRDHLKEKIEIVVETILNNFENDLELFTHLLEDFSVFTDLELRRGQLVEQRTKDSERGKAASDLAKQAVQDTLNSSLKGKKVPECVVSLLKEGWSRLMVLQYLKDGDTSKAWKESSSLVDDLIWTVCPVSEGSETGTKLLRMIPGVIKGLRTGLLEASFDEFKTNELLKELEDAQVSAIQNIQHEEANSVTEPESNNEAALAEPNNQNTPSAENQKEQQSEAVAELIRETEEMEAEYNQQLQSTNPSTPSNAQVERNADNVDENLGDEEIVLSALEAPVAEAKIDESDPFVQQVDKLSMGCWFEFQTEDKPERCKLAAVIKATGKYIFVNRSGVKVAEKTRMGLAVELRRGSVQMLSDGLLFDRALESVIGNLRGRNKQTD